MLERFKIRKYQSCMNIRFVRLVLVSFSIPKFRTWNVLKTRDRSEFRILKRCITMKKKKHSFSWHFYHVDIYFCHFYSYFYTEICFAISTDSTLCFVNDNFPLTWMVGSIFKIPHVTRLPCFRYLSTYKFTFSEKQ